MIVIGIVTGNQIILHLIGDYLLQNGWIANNKHTSKLICFLHSLLYTFPFFIFLHPSYLSLLVILSTHFLIDYYDLGKKYMKMKDTISPHSFTPKSLSSDLQFIFKILVDNTMHLIINGLSIYYL